MKIFLNIFPRILGWICLVYALYIGPFSMFIESWQHPELTQMQIFKAFLPDYFAAILVAVLGVGLLSLVDTKDRA